MEKFNTIFKRAAKSKGGEKALEKLLPKPKSAKALKKIPDDRWLSEMTKRVFQAGFVWRVIENKWPAFETAFDGFDPVSVASMTDERIQQLMQDESIVRNSTKIRATRDNAVFVLELAQEYGSAGNFFASWPSDNLIGLFAVLKKRGSRLGGLSAQVFLRGMEKDSFILSTDVVAALIHQGVVSKEPSSKRDLAAVQAAFNTWYVQSHRPYSQISRVLACSIG